MMNNAIRSRAPVRLDLAGGWTDVPPFSKELGGAVVSVAVNLYTYTSLTPRPDKRFHITSADYGISLEIASFEELAYDGHLDLVKAALRRLGIRQGLNIFARGEAPPGSGMGSSASTGVALIGLLDAFRGKKRDPSEAGELAHLLETEELGIAGGKQDEYAAAYGGMNFMAFEDPVVRVTPLNPPDWALNELEKHLVLCYTGRGRVSGDIISTVMGAYRRRESRTVRALHRLKAIAAEMRDALLESNLEAFGALLRENWDNQKALHPSVTNPQIDNLFAIALAEGDIGGKALGAGGGGCLLFYCRPDREHVVCRALGEAGAQLLSFNFDFKGLQVWTVPQPTSVNLWGEP